MSTMVCGICGSVGILWVGDLLDNPSTKCPHCAGRNCQRVEAGEVPHVTMEV